MAGGERSGRVARPVGQAALAVPVVLYHKKKSIRVLTLSKQGALKHFLLTTLLQAERLLVFVF